MVSRRLLALASLLFVGSVLAGSAVAAPPPRPVCAACGDTVERRAESRGLDVAVTDSTATVTVHANGTATWVVRNTVSDRETVRRLRENATLRRALVDARYWDARLRSVTVAADGVVTARYRHPDFAVRSVGGTLRSVVFSENYGYGNLDGLGADRLTVVAPDGARIGATVPGATVSTDRSRMTLTDYDEGALVTFVPRDATLGFLWSWLAIADLVGPVVVVNAAIGVLVPTALAAAFVAIAGPLTRLDAPVTWVRASPARALLAGGVAAVALSLVGGALPVVDALVLPLFGVGVTALAVAGVLSTAAVERPSFRQVTVGALVGAGVAAVAAVAGGLLFYGRVPWYGLSPSLPFLLPAFAFAPVGHALARGHRRRAVATAAVGVAAATLVTVPLSVPVGILGLPFRVVRAVLGTARLVLAGLPFLLVGTAFGRAPDDGTGGTERP